MCPVWSIHGYAHKFLVQKLNPEQNIKKQTDQVKHEGNAEDLDDGLFAFSDI